MSRSSPPRVLAILLFAASASACAVRNSEPAPRAPVVVRTERAQPAAASAPASMFQSNADSACSHAGGTYLGNMKCQMPDGSISQIQSGPVDINLQQSALPVRSGGPQAWALATTAIMFDANGARHDLLGGSVAFPENAAEERQLLSKWWDVNDREQLLRTLSWLQSEGHRAVFEQLRMQVATLNEQQYAAAQVALRNDPQQQFRLQIVHQYGVSLGKSGILGFDLIRYIALCRWGYLSGFLSHIEAWRLIMPAAARLQAEFASWKDLQKNYLIGREFWSFDQTNENGDRFQAIVDRLLKDPSSPWNQNAWDMNLNVPAPLHLSGD